MHHSKKLYYGRPEVTSIDNVYDPQKIIDHFRTQKKVAYCRETAIKAGNTSNELETIAKDLRVRQTIWGKAV